MTFQECYEQTILPTYEELKREHEANGEGHSASIDTVGLMRRLELKVSEGDKFRSYLLSVTEQTIPGDTLYIYGVAHVRSSYQNRTKQLRGEHFRIEDLERHHLTRAMDRLKDLI